MPTRRRASERRTGGVIKISQSVAARRHGEVERNGWKKKGM
jgi:hypothetical protein